MSVALFAKNQQCITVVKVPRARLYWRQK